MTWERQKPADIARRLSQRSAKTRRAEGGAGDMWRRETFTLPRTEARDKAREWFVKYPQGRLYDRNRVLAGAFRRPDRIYHPAAAQRGLSFSVFVPRTGP